jgi:hypothetical protein
MKVRCLRRWVSWDRGRLARVFELDIQLVCGAPSENRSSRASAGECAASPPGTDKSVCATLAAALANSLCGATLASHEA